eukprot:gene1022-1297_t
MAGGVGQRLWPDSTQAMPKQFHDVLGIGKTLLQATADRFMNIVPQDRIWVVTQSRYADLVKTQLPWLASSQILEEPMAKNTAACILYACAAINEQDPNATLIITPADHHIQQEELQIQLIQQAVQVYDDASLVLMGVPCSHPATGYGYIAYDQHTEEVLKKVLHFVEKPLKEQAVSYITAGNYLWNTGIFIGQLRVFRERIIKHLPGMGDAFKEMEIALQLSREEGRERLLRLYKSLPWISFDQGVVEKMDCLYVACEDFGWTDLGTWEAIYAYSEKDTNGNVCRGEVMVQATSNCMIQGDGKRLVVTYGIDNLVVVQHQDVLMICPRDKVQHVKELVQQVTEAGYTLYL